MSSQRRPLTLALGALAAPALLLAARPGTGTAPGPSVQDAPAEQEGGQAGAQEGEQTGPDDGVRAAFAAASIQVDRESRTLSFPATIEIRGEALEYLLVTPNGAVHESLFLTTADPEVLAAAFLYIGAKPGENVVYTPVEPPPTREEVRAGAPTHDVQLPEGEPVYLYAAWREPAGAYDEEAGAYPDETLHFHRVEDLVLDLERQRTLRRHGFVWLGSRMIPGARAADPERFAAAATGNLICTTFFAAGDTLMTTSLPECISQTIWYPNDWMVPRRGGDVMLFASLDELDALPESYRESVPFVPEPPRDTSGR